MEILFQEIYKPNILTQNNSSIYISKLRKMQILELYWARMLGHKIINSSYLIAS